MPNPSSNENSNDFDARRGREIILRACEIFIFMLVCAFILYLVCFKKSTSEELSQGSIQVEAPATANNQAP